MKDKLKEQFLNVANSLIFRLNTLGVDCYIWHKATTGSIYIRFKDQRMCSIRIGDHNGREKLKYKWNIRSDIELNTSKWVKHNNIWRYYIHLHKWDELVVLLLKRKEEVEQWGNSKYSYTIPKYKNNETI